MDPGGAYRGHVAMADPPGIRPRACTAATNIVTEADIRAALAKTQDYLDKLADHKPLNWATPATGALCRGSTDCAFFAGEICTASLAESCLRKTCRSQKALPRSRVLYRSFKKHQQLAL